MASGAGHRTARNPGSGDPVGGKKRKVLEIVGNGAPGLVRRPGASSQASTGARVGPGDAQGLFATAYYCVLYKDGVEQCLLPRWDMSEAANPTFSPTIDDLAIGRIHVSLQPARCLSHARPTTRAELVGWLAWWWWSPLLFYPRVHRGLKGGPSRDSVRSQLRAITPSLSLRLARPSLSNCLAPISFARAAAITTVVAIITWTSPAPGLCDRYEAAFTHAVTSCTQTTEYCLCDASISEFIFQRSRFY